MSAEKDIVSDVFGISVSALQAFQAAITVTSNKCGQRQAPRAMTGRRVILTAGAPQTNGVASVGSGVVVSGISRSFRSGSRQSAEYLAERPRAADGAAELLHPDRQPVRHHRRRLEHPRCRISNNAFSDVENAPTSTASRQGAAWQGAERREQLPEREFRTQQLEYRCELTHLHGRHTDQFHGQRDLDAEYRRSSWALRKTADRRPTNWSTSGINWSPTCRNWSASAPRRTATVH